VISESAPAPSPPGGHPTATFEAAYQELCSVIERLEDGGLGLDEAVRVFERGCELARVCERLVEDAELRVTRLAPEAAAPRSDAPADEE
jgi:exodeoxyribonuclease VII small subunit